MKDEDDARYLLGAIGDKAEGYLQCDSVPRPSVSSGHTLTFIPPSQRTFVSFLCVIAMLSQSHSFPFAVNGPTCLI